MTTYSDGLAAQSWKDWELGLDADRKWRSSTPTFNSTSTYKPSEYLHWSSDDPTSMSSLDSTINNIPGSSKSSSGLWSWLTESDKKDPRAMTTSWDTNLGKIGNIVGLGGSLYSLYDNLFGQSAEAKDQMLKNAKLEYNVMKQAQEDKAAWKSALAANAKTAV